MKTYFLQFGNGDPRSYSGLTPTMVIFYSAGAGTTLTGPAISEIYSGAGIYQFQFGVTQPITFLADGFTTGITTALRYVAGALDPSDRADEYGTTLTAIGTSNIALGTTAVALGTTTFALGTTSVALGITNLALEQLGFNQGSSILALGTSGVALGTTSVALGITNLALEQLAFNQGSSIVALGTTSVAIGTTILSSLTGLSSLYLGIGSTASSYGTQTSDPVDAFGYLKRILENLEGNQTFTKLSGSLSIYSRGSTTLLRAKTVSNTSTTVTKSGS